MAKGFPKGRGGSKANTRVVKVPGQPPETSLQQNWRVRFGYLPTRKRGVRTLIKQDPAIDKKARGQLTDQAGVDTGTGGGFKGGVRVIHQKPIVPPKPLSNVKKVSTPVASGGKKVGGSAPAANAISRFRRKGR